MTAFPESSRYLICLRRRCAWQFSPLQGQFFFIFFVPPHLFFCPLRSLLLLLRNPNICPSRRSFTWSDPHVLWIALGYFFLSFIAYLFATPPCLGFGYSPCLPSSLTIRMRTILSVSIYVLIFFFNYVVIFRAGRFSASFVSPFPRLFYADCFLSFLPSTRDCFFPPKLPTFRLQQFSLVFVRFFPLRCEFKPRYPSLDIPPFARISPPLSFLGKSYSV